MMVPGRCSRQRVSRIGGANPLPHGARPWFDSPAKIIRLRRQQRAPEQGPGFTQKQFAQLVRRYKSRCLACRQRYERLIPDHVVPLAKGGDHHISNIQPLCYECNAFKGTHGFRLILQNLAYREIERYSNGSPTGRRIVGVYLTWNGDPQGGFYGALAHLPRGSEASFWNRYGVAERVGAANDFRDALRRIVTAVKHDPGHESPLVLLGHSMGALMMQSAFATLLEQGALVKPSVGATVEPTRVTSNGAPVLFPDLVLSLNSAADSEFARRILAAYRTLGLTKVARASASATTRRCSRR
jgi:hypothetical protein